MKKNSLRRLRLNRETVRDLSRDELGKVAGGLRTDDTCYNSCDPSVTRPQSACNSCLNTCQTCQPVLCS